MKFLEGSVCLAIVAKNLVVFLMVIFVAPAWGQPAAGKRMFAVAYPGPSDLRISNVILVVPFVRISESWRSFSSRKPHTEEEAALQELLSAVYRGDPTAAAARVSPPKHASSGSAFANYINAFKASLERAGEIEVEGYFPLSGRVRFALRPIRATTSHRLLTMRFGKDGRLRFDETEAPNKVDGVLNTIFHVLKNVPLEIPRVPVGNYVTVIAEENTPHGEVQLAVKARLVDADLEQINSGLDPPLQFYKECLQVSAKTLMKRYFQCFPADIQSRLREEFTKMSAEKQNDLASIISSPRHIDFVVENPSSEVVYYHSSSHAVASRDWIERTSAGGFVLMNPLSSFPLDDLLSSKEVRASIGAALRQRKPTPENRSK